MTSRLDAAAPDLDARLAGLSDEELRLVAIGEDNVYDHVVEQSQIKDFGTKITEMIESGQLQ